MGHCDDLEVDFDSPEARINAKCDGKETEAWNLSKFLRRMVVATVREVGILSLTRIQSSGAYVVYEGGRLVPK